MVYLCATIAAASPRLTVEAIDAASFADLVSRHRIGTIPRLLLDDAVELPDRLPPGELIARIAAGA